MKSPWYCGTINAIDIGKGNFVSTDLQNKRLNLFLNNSKYREAIEKAQKIAGYEDKLILASRNRQKNALNTLFEQSHKAEKFTKDNTDENIKHSNIIICD